MKESVLLFSPCYAGHEGGVRSIFSQHDYITISCHPSIVDRTSRRNNSPGTARCLRGMALSLEGSEPIQSAFTLPIPAGLVFISAAACQQYLLQETALRYRRLPTRSQHAKATIVHLEVSRLIFRCYNMHHFKFDRFHRRVPRRPLHVCMSAGLQPANRACIDKTSGELTSAAILLERNLLLQVKHTAALGKTLNVGHVDRMPLRD